MNFTHCSSVWMFTFYLGNPPSFWNSFFWFLSNLVWRVIIKYSSSSRIYLTLNTFWNSYGLRLSSTKFGSRSFNANSLMLFLGSSLRKTLIVAMSVVLTINFKISSWVYYSLWSCKCLPCEQDSENCFFTFSPSFWFGTSTSASLYFLLVINRLLILFYIVLATKLFAFRI